jgi:hypothetical protein
MSENKNEVAKGLENPCTIKQERFGKWLNVMIALKGEKVLPIFGSELSYINRDNNLFVKWEFERLFGKKIDFIYDKQTAVWFEEMVKGGDIKCKKQSNQLHFDSGTVTTNVDIPEMQYKQEMPINLSDFEPFAQPLELSDDDRKKTKVSMTKENQFVKLCFSEGRLKLIRRIEKSIGTQVCDHFIGDNPDLNGTYDLTLESTDFLRIKADHYQLTVLKNEDQYLLNTVYDIEGQRIMTYEKLRHEGDEDPKSKLFQIPEKAPEELDVIEPRVKENYLHSDKSKTLVIQDLCKIKKHDDYHFLSGDLKQYRDHFAFYIRDTYNQHRSTYYNDARIVEMLVEKDKEDILYLEKEGIVSMLKAISYADDSIKDKLLDEFENLDLTGVNDEIEKFRNENGSKPSGSAKLNLSWLKLVKSKKTDRFTANFVEKAISNKVDKERKRSQFKKVVEMLETMSESMLAKVIDTYDQLKADQ